MKFWDAPSKSLHVLYKLRTYKLFDKPPDEFSKNEDPFAVTELALCAESRQLAVAGQAGHVMVFDFAKVETTAEEIPVIDAFRFFFCAVLRRFCIGSRVG